MNNNQSQSKKAFSLIEVVLAMGVFALAIVAIIGLLAPTLSSVSSVVTSQRAISAVGAIEEYLQNFPDKDSDSSFDRIYTWVSDNEKKFLIAYNYMLPSGVSRLVVEEVNGSDRERPVNPTTLTDSEGEVFLIMIDAARFNEVETGTPPNTSLLDMTDPSSSLPSNPDNYYEGYLAMRVRLYALPPYQGMSPAEQSLVNSRTISSTDIETIELEYELVLDYHTAINR